MLPTSPVHYQPFVTSVKSQDHPELIIAVNAIDVFFNWTIIVHGSTIALDTTITDHSFWH
jgi:hypothetical protein